MIGISDRLSYSKRGYRSLQKYKINHTTSVLICIFVYNIILLYRFIFYKTTLGLKFGVMSSFKLK